MNIKNKINEINNYCQKYKNIRNEELKEKSTQLFKEKFSYSGKLAVILLNLLTFGTYYIQSNFRFIIDMFAITLYSAVFFNVINSEAQNINSLFSIVFFLVLLNSFLIEIYQSCVDNVECEKEYDESKLNESISLKDIEFLKGVYGEEKINNLINNSNHKITYKLMLNKLKSLA